MAMPDATIKMTKPCRATSKALRFHSASPKETPAVVAVLGLETEKKMAGKDKTILAPINAAKLLGEVFFVGLSLNISPDKNKMANVPTPTANWKMAT